jgi:hypothetical protein
MPLKYWLWRQGLIHSTECRLPLTRVSTLSAHDLDALPSPNAVTDNLVNEILATQCFSGRDCPSPPAQLTTQASRVCRTAARFLRAPLTPRTSC